MAGFSTSARTGLIWLAGLAVAAFSGMAAFASVSGARNPLAAVGALPENGQVYASAADAVLKLAIQDNKGAMPKAIPERSLGFARRAFAIEPLAVQAPRMVALALDAEGESEEARRIMRLIPPLSKREAATNVWLSADYARQGNEAKAFAYFDMTLRVSESSVPLIIPPLVQGLEREELRAPLAKLLASAPPWENDFWLEAVQRPELAIPAARLRRDLGRKQGSTLAVDRGLIENLVDEGNFAEALRHYRFLTGKQAAQDLNFPFERAPAFPPLDWELQAAGDFSAAIDPGATQMVISAGPATRDVVARRLVALEPGRYRATVDYSATLADGVTVSLALRCAETRAQPVRTTPYVPGQATSQIITTGGTCRYHLLEIEYRNDSPIDGVDITLDAITLRKEA
jgi:hypothetical protein